jgi:hypothetical protein
MYKKITSANNNVYYEGRGGKMDFQGKISADNDYNCSIACSVTECKYNSRSDKYCTLDKIQVVKHEAEAKNAQCTDCGSFMRLG